MKPYVGTESSGDSPSANSMDTASSNDLQSEKDEIEQLHEYDLISEQNPENGTTATIETYSSIEVDTVSSVETNQVLLVYLVETNENKEDQSTHQQLAKRFPNILG